MGLPSMEGVAGDVAGDVAVAQVRGAVLLLFSFLLFFFFFFYLEVVYNQFSLRIISKLFCQ